MERRALATVRDRVCCDDVTPPPRLENSEGTPLLMIAGGLGGAAGAIAVLVGVAPLLAAHDHRAVLTTFEESARADEQFLVENSDAIAQEQASLTEALDGWRSYGIATAIVGAVVITASAAAIGVSFIE